MLTLIGTILFVYVMWLVVKPLVASYMRRKFQQKVNDMFRQAMGGAPGHGNDPFGTHKRHTQQTEKPVKRKIFSRDEGEYIEFEEVQIHVEYTETTTSETTDSPSYTPREPQVSDAVWEDIP